MRRSFQEKTDDIGWYASDQKGQIMFVQPDRDVDASKKRSARHLRSLAESGSTVKPDRSGSLADYGILCVWTRTIPPTFCGLLPMRRRRHTIHMGFVTAGRDRTIWVRETARERLSISSGISPRVPLCWSAIGIPFEKNQTMEDGTFPSGCNGQQYRSGPVLCGTEYPWHWRIPEREPACT